MRLDGWHELDKVSDNASEDDIQVCQRRQRAQVNYKGGQVHLHQSFQLERRTPELGP